ncbi:hypothetical protein HUN08_11025 [Gordonia sp. X0973]|uniref:hypothetical protein n=1 Tax=Gordonia sp. X0973 TaxID=2742602 RepID=UPI000F536859|nr:hypothetical protein [Gordonia sp. X0973]QKT07663.1 hypothetical protein HUN08_11025 [Gordonia sp. X0973]
MTDTIAFAAPRRVAAAVVALGAAGMLMGCTVSGTAHAPNSDVVAKYVAEQKIITQKKNARTQCSDLRSTLGEGVRDYNKMIDQYNSSGGNFAGLDKQVITKLDANIEALNQAQSVDLPDDLKTQIGVVKDATQTQRDRLAAGNIDSLNDSAHKWNDVRRQLDVICLRY